MIDERMVINLSGGHFFRDIQPHELSQAFVRKFNQGDTIYPYDSPIAVYVRPDHIEMPLAYTDHKDGSIKYFCDMWPTLIGCPGYFFDDGSGNLVKVTDKFGWGARTRLNMEDYAKWTMFWSINDLFDSSGIPMLGNDDRVPLRSDYLRAYQSHNYHQELFDGFSKEEIETEVRNRASRAYALPRWLDDLISDWANDCPDHFYRVCFKGPMVFIDRRADVKTIAYHANKENHPLLAYIQQKNLV